MISPSIPYKKDNGANWGAIRESSQIDNNKGLSANTLIVLMSNDETAATEAWKVMVAESVPNVYILEGDINGWLDIFSTGFEEGFCAETTQAGDDELRYEFTAALGSGCPATYPDAEHYELEFEKEIKMERKHAPSGGGCG